MSDYIREAKILAQIQEAANTTLEAIEEAHDLQATLDTNRDIMSDTELLELHENLRNAHKECKRMFQKFAYVSGIEF